MSLKTYDDYTYTHSLNLGALSVLLGSELDMPRDELETLGMSGILHDIGKSLLPREIVNKPGPLTKEEFECMKQHPAVITSYSIHYTKLYEGCSAERCGRTPAAGSD